MTAPLLTLENLTKRFFGIDALSDVSLSISGGEIHAVVGENGAGKSTLMKLLVGVHSPDAGRMLWQGEPISPAGPSAARQLGIDIVFQESELPNNLTVLDAIFLGKEPRAGGVVGRALGCIDHRAAHGRALAALRRLGADFALDRAVGQLSVAERQLVQIARALATDVRLLILDEPTSALGEREAERLFARLVELRTRGIAILYVSHRLEEIERLADRVTVLRDGRHIATRPMAELTRETLVALILGRESPATPSQGPRLPTPADAADDGRTAVLEVRGISLERRYHDVSFTLAPGEVVGLFGVVGAGRTEIARGIFGIDRIDVGEIRVDGRMLPRHQPAASVDAGIALVPEDRQHHGLVAGMSLGRNLTLAHLGRIAVAGWIRALAERRIVNEAIAALAIRPPDAEIDARFLSGGNQQKVVIGRWLATRPRVLILDEPTRGIDIGAKAEVHVLIRRLASEGMAVLLISSELEETFGLSDRVLVLRRGRLVGEVDPQRVSAAETLAMDL